MREPIRNGHLRRLRLDDNTLVIFMADQGLAGGHSGFWGMGDHTRPLTAFDWTTWIPMIFRHKAALPAGRTSKALVSNYDVLPSVLSYLGLKDELPNQPPSPGRDVTPILRGQEIDWDDTVFFEFENVRSIRTEKWKYIERIYQQPNELYDLESDVGERMNLYGRPEFTSIQGELTELLHVFFDRYAEPEWDLWKGANRKPTSSRPTSSRSRIPTGLRATSRDPGKGNPSSFPDTTLPRGYGLADPSSSGRGARSSISSNEITASALNLR